MRILHPDLTYRHWWYLFGLRDAREVSATVVAVIYLISACLVHYRVGEYQGHRMVDILGYANRHMPVGLP